MKLEVPQPEEQSFHLLGIQVVGHDNGLVVRRGSSRIYLEGPSIAELFELLTELADRQDGIRLTDFLKAVAPHLRDTARLLFEALQQRRLLVKPRPRGDSANATNEEVFYWSYGTSLSAVAETLNAVDIAVIGLNYLSIPLAMALAEARFGAVDVIDHPAFRNVTLVNEAGSPKTELLGGANVLNFEEWSDRGQLPRCLVVTSDFGGLTLMREWNSFCVDSDTLFFPVVLQDQIAFIGPMTVPRQSPCFECFWRRHNSNLDSPDLERATELAAYRGQSVADFLPLMSRMAAELAAMELIKFFSQALPGGNLGRLIEFEMVAPRLSVRKLLKAPRCPVCSTIRRTPTPAADISVFMPGNE